MSSHPLRQYRKQRNLSLEALALEIGIGASDLHHLEYNRGRKVTRKIIAWCHKQQVNPAIFYPDG